jgi:hypothetical protein
MGLAAPYMAQQTKYAGAEQNGKKSVYHIRDFYLRHFAGTGKEPGKIGGGILSYS